VRPGRIAELGAPPFESCPRGQQDNISDFDVNGTTSPLIVYTDEIMLDGKAGKSRSQLRQGALPEPGRSRRGQAAQSPLKVPDERCVPDAEILRHDENVVRARVGYRPSAARERREHSELRHQ